MFANRRSSVSCAWSRPSPQPGAAPRTEVLEQIAIHGQHPLAGGPSGTEVDQRVAAQADPGATAGTEHQEREREQHPEPGQRGDDQADVVGSRGGRRFLHQDR